MTGANEVDGAGQPQAAGRGPVDRRVRPWDVPVGGLGTPIQERLATWANGLIDAAAAAARERSRLLIEECRAALAEELSAWDIDPPLHHVQQAHDKCVAWLEGPNAKLTGGPSGPSG